MRTILVTGAAGFIGQRTCQMLLDAGHQVVGLDNLNDYYDPRLKRYRLKSLEAHSGFRFIKGDIEDGSFLERVFEENAFEAVINLAARAGVRASIEEPHVYFTTNVQGTLNLLQRMERHGVRTFVLASTSSLYAGQPAPFREDANVTRPISPYAASKLAAEALAHTWHHLHGIDVAVLRYFTVYGPAGRPDMSPFRFIEAIGRGEPITVYGDGTQTRDFTYVDDIARGTVMALTVKGYEIINLGGGNEPWPLKSMIGFLEEELEQPAQIKREAFQAADMKDTAADVSKARNLLGWQPRVGVEEGFRRTVAWHKQKAEMLRVG